MNNGTKQAIARIAGLVVAILAVSVRARAADPPRPKELSEAAWSCINHVFFAPNTHIDFVVKQHPDWRSNPEARAAVLDGIRQNIFSANTTGVCLAYMLDSSLADKAMAIEYKDAFANLRSATQNLTQMGSGSSASGSTNLVSKNLTSNLFSLASEYGGITQSTSGQTTTFSGSLSGIPLQLESKSGAPLFAECTATVAARCINYTALDWLSRVSYSVGVGTGGGSAGSGTASVGSGTTQPVTLSSAGSSSAYSLSQVTAKFTIFRQLPSAATLATAAKKISGPDFKKAAQNLVSALGNVYTSTNSDTKQNLEKASEALLDGYVAGPSGYEAAWKTASQYYYQAAESSTVVYNPVVAAFLVDLGQFTAQEDLIYENAIKPTVTTEYDLNTPTSQPSNSAFRMIVSWVPGKSSNGNTPVDRKSGSKQASATQPSDSPRKSTPADDSDSSKESAHPGNWTLTFNVAASIYNSQPASSIPNGRRLRDIQIAAEADYKIPKNLPLVGPPTLSGSFYYQDQTSPAILKVPISGLPITGLSSSTNQIFTQRGPLDIGQFKVSFGSSKSGLRVPLAFTVANRTELLQGMDVKGQIGISYDFDSLLSK